MTPILLIREINIHFNMFLEKLFELYAWQASIVFFTVLNLSLTHREMQRYLNIILKCPCKFSRVIKARGLWLANLCGLSGQCIWKKLR